MYGGRQVTTKETYSPVGGRLAGERNGDREAGTGGLSAVSLVRPVAEALSHAPEDDESVTDEGAAAIEDGQREVDAGRVVTTAQVRARLGL